eukprot:CAMPEP_0113829064 /NCGR_PEP_ID=MMETSP0328-20130328/5603_1 /TAXON_ID=39455 /ORGANISM="Alexandrium minutum" /LENGTH=192 /DNA_ID=CAMNT_0000797099 /DNA_START=24 /DNA_END=602 /DNA_ORIENTATION=+ /assembly_acc=CAM_ASM_000350
MAGLDRACDHPPEAIGGQAICPEAQEPRGQLRPPTGEAPARHLVPLIDGHHREAQPQQIVGHTVWATLRDRNCQDQERLHDFGRLDLVPLRREEEAELGQLSPPRPGMEDLLHHAGVRRAGSSVLCHLSADDLRHLARKMATKRICHGGPAIEGQLAVVEHREGRVRHLRGIERQQRPVMRVITFGHCPEGR